MIGLIIEKTLLKNIYDARFVVASIIILLLMVASGLLMAREINHRLEQAIQRERRAQSERNLEAITLVKRPSRLAFIADGGEGDLPWTVRVTPELLDTSDLQIAIGSFIERFPLFDWVYIVGVVVSLMALFFSHDVIAGEKESGLLSMQLANPVPRRALLIGGYLGTLLSFIPLLLLGLLSSLVLVVVLTGLEISTQVLGRVMIVLTLTLVYVSIFVGVGLLVSSLTHSSPTALISGLMIWVVLVVIIPQSSGPRAATITKVPSDQALQNDIRSLRFHLAGGRISDMMLDDIVRTSATDAQKQRWAEELAERETARYVEQQRDLQRRIARLIEGYTAEQDRQLMVARGLARLSPMGMFQYAVEEVVNAGYAHHRNFLLAARGFMPIYTQYAYAERESKRQQAEPGSYGEIGHGLIPKPVRIVFTYDYSTIPVDSRAFPPFHESQPSIEESLTTAFRDIAVMLLISISLLCLTHFIILRYDVR